MPKRILSAVFALLLCGVPAIAENAWNEQLAAPQAEVLEVKFAVQGSNVRITGAAKTTLEVYNLTGVCMATFRIDSEDKTVQLNLPKGIYILKIGDVARKIALR